MNKGNIRERFEKIIVPLIAILGGFLTGIIILLLTGKNPIVMIQSIIKGTIGFDLRLSMYNSRLLGEFITASLPLILTGLSFAFAFRTGLFNIGTEGQLIVGSYAAIAIGFLVDWPRYFHLPLVIIASILAGALWGFIPGYLKAKWNVHEVVTTIMLNYTAMYTSNYLLRFFPMSNLMRTVPIPFSATLHSPLLQDLTNNSRLHWGFILVIFAVIIYWFIINRTAFGYELRAVGHNPHASKYAGMKVRRNTILSMMIAGSFAGLAGALVAVGMFDFGRILYAFENYGLNGLGVALVGNNTALGVFLSGLLFGGLTSSQPHMQNVGIPKEIGQIIQASIVVFVAMQYGIRKLIAIRSTKTRNEMPTEEDS
mgnify:FL=1